MRVLVTYGSTRGGTAGIAKWIARALAEEGFQVDVLPTAEVEAVEDYDAVVVGGALYMARWHREARRFVRHYTEVLRARPVWLFSSGPLEESEDLKDMPPVAQVQRLMERIGARGHITFGGRLQPGARGFIASKMARTRAGDWRDPRVVHDWAKRIAAELLSLEAGHHPPFPSTAGETRAAEGLSASPPF